MYGIYHIVISSKQFSGKGGLIKYHYHYPIPSIHLIKIALHLQSVLVNADSLPPKYIDDWNVTNGNTIILVMSSLF